MIFDKKAGKFDMETFSVKCPKCGGRIEGNSKAYGCEHWRDSDGGCKATIWKRTWGHDVTPEEAAVMFQGGVIGPIEVTLKSGMKKMAKMRYDVSANKCVLEFEGAKKEESAPQGVPSAEQPQMPAGSPFGAAGPGATDWGDPGFM